ncbi:STAS domain-containing protein [Massilia sp. DWR3-1-1]|uniref:STAS domain-containing protein n=1 Tax=Massilia sp. DWR3-1-1 TaxID=2804559 RepID=UPI003CE91F49
MGLFGFLKKKERARETGAGPATRTGEPSRLDTEAERARQREIARATTAKIDAIESAMAHDIFNEPEPAWGASLRRPARTSAQLAADAGAGATLPMLELATTELLSDDAPALPGAEADADSAPVVDEIAITFANGEVDSARQMLRDSLAGDGGADRTVWWMLFDLYQTGAHQAAFEDLSIDYASRFETSPPTWAPLAPGKAAGSKPFAGVTPTEAFGPLLDEAIAPQLARLLALAPGGAPSRLEFGRVQAVTAEGCARLLQALIVLRGGGRELIVAGAADLAEIVRASLAMGERTAPEAPWLLLLELLQLMNREKDFEEAAMDYCVTYELSPPQFEAPANVATAATAHLPSRADRFMLPALIDGDAGALFDAIDAYAAHTDLVVLDGSRLGRIEYAAATVLIGRLRALAAQDKVIELRDINHLATVLFKLLGYADVARLYPHKY